MMITNFTAVRHSNLVSPRRGGGSATGAAVISKAPRNTGATTI
ncbi:MAG: hypothetical protein WBV06_09910 [Acidimicrobiia bacterium]